MQVQVDEQKCQGHGMCSIGVPGVFEQYDIEGHARVIADPVPEGDEDMVELAVRSCPEQAIEIV